MAVVVVVVVVAAAAAAAAAAAMVLNRIIKVNLTRDMKVISNHQIMLSRR